MRTAWRNGSSGRRTCNGCWLPKQNHVIAFCCGCSMPPACGVGSLPLALAQPARSRRRRPDHGFRQEWPDPGDPLARRALGGVDGSAWIGESRGACFSLAERKGARPRAGSRNRPAVPLGEPESLTELARTGCATPTLRTPSIAALPSTWCKPRLAIARWPRPAATCTPARTIPARASSPWKDSRQNLAELPCLRPAPE